MAQYGYGSTQLSCTPLWSVVGRVVFFPEPEFLFLSLLSLPHRVHCKNKLPAEARYITPTV